jgi:hypothetical protein
MRRRRVAAWAAKAAAAGAALMSKKSGFYCNSLKCTFKTLATNNFGMRNFVQFILEVEVRFFLINQSNYVIKLTYLSESKIVSPIF